MAFKSKTIDISRAKTTDNINDLLKKHLDDGYDVRAMTKDVVILTKQTAR